MKRYRQVAGFILAGGASSRMGRDKGLLDFGGSPLILRTAGLLGQITAEVTIVGSPRRYASLGLHTIPDESDADDRRRPNEPGCGPLVGIATALAATRMRWNMIVACDLPYLSAEWLDWLLSRAVRSNSEAIIPQTERGIEPLVAVYHRNCRVPIVAELARGVRKVSDAIGELRVDFVYPREWHRFDPGGQVLRNMNEPCEYEEARKWWAANRMPVKKPGRKRRPAPKRNRQFVPRRRP